MPPYAPDEPSEVETIPHLVALLAALALEEANTDVELETAAAVIERLFRTLGHEDLTAVVELAVRNGTYTLEQGIAVLEVATWCGVENGAAITRTLESWLEWGDSRLRVAIALGHAQSVYPFLERARMEAVLARVAEAWPEHTDRCAALIEARRALPAG